MRQNKKVLIIIPIVLVIAAVIGGVVFWMNKNSSSQTENAASADNNSQMSAVSLSPTNAEEIPLNGSSTTTDEEGGLAVENKPASNPAVMGSGTTAKPESNEPNQTSPSAPGPETFAEYEKYKTSPNALFGDIQVGNGNPVSAGKTVAVYYKGWLTNGQLFDESGKTPFVFKVGARQVIPGWEQLIVGMKPGGTRRMIIPPALGYGANQQGPIPANSVLVFDVQLIAFE